jgi:circadian clock protein KaiB
MSARSPRAGSGGICRLVLFVAGDEANSRLARSNLDRLCASVSGHAAEIEVVDVLEKTDRALAHAILVTPTLLRLEPLPQVRVIGNLADLEKVSRALGLERVDEGVAHG